METIKSINCKHLFEKFQKFMEINPEVIKIAGGLGGISSMNLTEPIVAQIQHENDTKDDSGFPPEFTP